MQLLSLQQPTPQHDGGECDAGVLSAAARTPCPLRCNCHAAGRCLMWRTRARRGQTTRINLPGRIFSSIFVLINFCYHLQIDCDLGKLKLSLLVATNKLMSILSCTLTYRRMGCPPRRRCTWVVRRAAAFPSGAAPPSQCDPL